MIEALAYLPVRTFVLTKREHKLVPLFPLVRLSCLYIRCLFKRRRRCLPGKRTVNFHPKELQSLQWQATLGLHAISEPRFMFPFVAFELVAQHGFLKLCNALTYDARDLNEAGKIEGNYIAFAARIRLFASRNHARDPTYVVRPVSPGLSKWFAVRLDHCRLLISTGRSPPLLATLNQNVLRSVVSSLQILFCACVVPICSHRQRVPMICSNLLMPTRLSPSRVTKRRLKDPREKPRLPKYANCCDKDFRPRIPMG